MIRLFNIFTKITGWPVQWVCFRTKIHYEDPAVQKRHIRGPAIVICNHTAVYDYAVLMFVFFTRTLRCQMAEVLFEKKALAGLLRRLGGIRVDRNSYDFGFLAESEEVLRRGGVVGIFPESRLALPEEERPLPFKPSAAFLALSSGVPVIPVYTNGSYFSRRRAHVMIGTPMDVTQLVRDDRDDRENIRAVSEAMRQRVIQLEKEYLERYEH